jgi:hypothetical protein
MRAGEIGVNFRVAYAASVRFYRGRRSARLRLVISAEVA